MDIALIEAKALFRRLAKLIEEHDSISIAVAWGQLTNVAETLIANKAKFESVLIGADFSATDPDLIHKLAGVPNAFIARNRPGCFHPKIYYFQSGDSAEAIVGSANFTKGGLTGNFEASVHVKGAASDPFMRQVRDQIERYAPLRLPITGKLAASYRRQAEAAKRMPRPRNAVLPQEGDDDEGDWARFNSPIATMSWDRFAKRVRRKKDNDFGQRMALVRETQKMFARKGSFADLSLAEWKGVAGLLGKVEAGKAGLGDVQWGWFGSMQRATDFARAVGLQAPAIARALDLIPRRGDVTRDEFERYVTRFKRALPASEAGNPIATATRLLAMKRPDIFVCVDSGNKARISKALEFPPTRLTLENYWEWVIEPIRQAPWYIAGRPAGDDAELWDARVAMLDAIYYRPNDK